MKNSKSEYSRSSVEMPIRAGEKATMTRAMRLAALLKEISIHLKVNQQNAAPANTEGNRSINSE